jgi:very-short-patch-repair endonuclease
VTRLIVPSDFVRVADGLRFAAPVYAAVELAASDDGRAVCELLRRRLATPSQLQEALAAMAGSRGQAVRRCVVDACMANPWSYAELRLHRILRAAGITGWVANATLRLDGDLVHPDVLFRSARVVLEFDGRGIHDDPVQFLRDRERQNQLVTHGYVVVRFGWEHLDQPDYIVKMVRRALRAAGHGA